MAIGDSLMDLNTASGNLNVVLGAGSARQLTNGSRNVIIGNAVAVLLSSGSRNIAIGDSTMDKFSVFGNDNISIGSMSGRFLNSGNENVFIGRGSGDSVVSGIRNVFIGSDANVRLLPSGLSSVNGVANSTAIGYGANVGGNNATAIGAFAQANQSNSVAIGGIAGVNGAVVSDKVGIGTNLPNSRLHVNGSVSYAFRVIGSGITTTLTENDYILIAEDDSTIASPFVTLPSAFTCPGRVYKIINRLRTAAGGTANLNISTFAVVTETCSFGCIYILSFFGSISSGTTIEVMSDGTKWIELSHTLPY